MAISKSHKAEKITTDRLAGETLDVVNEMMSIIVYRTKTEGNDQNFEYSGRELRYFGVGNQLKVSKLADSLYSTMKDVVIFVMNEMAKESDVDYKFQLPKHTSFVGSIVKQVAIEVIARNMHYRDYLASLCDKRAEYKFDANDDIFQNIYRDTVLRLDEQGYLFEDDPELMSLRKDSKSLPMMGNALATRNPLEGINITTEDIIPTVQASRYNTITLKDSDSMQTEEELEILDDLDEMRANSRNRIILPYLRRLFETHKSSIVTKKRVDLICESCEPDDEIKHAFNEKYNEILSSSKDQCNMSQDIVRGHCVFTTLKYLKEHYPKERVDSMEGYLKNDKTLPTKARKRYVKVPSGKRGRFDGIPSDFPMGATSADQIHDNPMINIM